MVNKVITIKNPTTFKGGGASTGTTVNDFFTGTGDAANPNPCRTRNKDRLIDTVGAPWGSYGVNESILVPGSAGIRVSSITSPSKKVIYCSASGGATTFKSSWIFNGNDFVNQGLSPGIYYPDPRNDRKAVCLFADGHVERLDVKNMDQEARRKYFTLDP